MQRSQLKSTKNQNKTKTNQQNSKQKNINKDQYIQ